VIAVGRDMVVIALPPCPGCDGQRDHPALRWCAHCRRVGSNVLTDLAMTVAR
jgi:hypothetical protein